MLKHKQLATILIISAFLIAIIGCAGTDSQLPDTRKVQHRRHAELGQPDQVYHKDGWELSIYRTNKGTRSEGRHGILLQNGQEVVGERGEKRDTPLGTVYYYGSLEQKAYLWDTSGWDLYTDDQEQPDVAPRVPRRLLVPPTE